MLQCVAWDWADHKKTPSFPNLVVYVYVCLLPWAGDAYSGHCPRWEGMCERHEGEVS